MSEQFEIKDTRLIQSKSLCNFAAQLGYWFSVDGYFMKEDEFGERNSDKNIISFRTMVDLHNNGNLDNHGQVYERMGFDLYSFEKAKGSKIVDQVFLTMNKKTGYIHVHKHLVKFTKPFYEQLFLERTSER